MQRAEHNDGILATLEEVSLHQLNIEKIELLGHMCKHLRILYLQSNLIARLENLHKLKVFDKLPVQASVPWSHCCHTNVGAGVFKHGGEQFDQDTKPAAL